MSNTQTLSTPVTFSSAAEVASSFGENAQNIQNFISPTAKAVNLAFTSTQKALEQLAAKREIWEQGVYRTATIELYSLLADCYAFYKSMEGNTDAAKDKRKALDDYCNIRGFNFKQSTHSINKIIACVFGGLDRRRISAYATAVRKALGNKIAVKDFVDYFVNAGGLEEVRLNRAGTALSPKDKIKIAAQKIQGASLGKLANKALGKKLDAGNIGKPTVLLGTWNADGSIDICALVESKGVVNAALAGYYSAEKTAQKNAEAEAEMESLEALKKKAIEAAVVEALFITEAVA